jgi:hypothetical protein
MLTSGLTSALVQIMDELGTDGGTYVVGIKPRSQASALPLIQPGMRLVGVGHRECSRLLCVQLPPSVLVCLETSHARMSAVGIVKSWI